MLLLEVVMPLQCSWGVTRFVILIGPVAIKIARFRLTWIPKRLFHFIKRREVGTKIAYQARNPRLALNNIFAGILANRTEYRFWQRHPYRFLMPTTYSLLGGAVNIQRRGERITNEELVVSHPFRELIAEMPPELIEDLVVKTANFCRYGEKIYLLDYGREDASDFLRRAGDNLAA